MLSIFNLCTPRDEVLKGELREDIFAARLKDVMDCRSLAGWRFCACCSDGMGPSSQTACQIPCQNVMILTLKNKETDGKE